MQTNLSKIHNTIIQEQDFDENVWQRAQIKNNSGYIDEEYQTIKQFPIIPEYHFRVEDDQTILQFQKLTMTNTDNQPLQFTTASNKFHNKLTSLLQSINNVHITNQPQKQPTTIECHGFYSLDKDYDNDSSIKQAFARLQVIEVQDKLQNLTLNQTNKPKFIKKIKNNGNKMNSQPNFASPVNNLSRQFNKLSIDQEDL